MGSFYKDDNGHLWRYDVRRYVADEGGSFPYGDARGVTDAYGGAVTQWFERGSIDNAHDEINAAIDLKAAILGASEAAAKAAASVKKSDGTGTKPTPPGSSSVPSTTKKDTTPTTTSSPMSSNMKTLLLGVLGIGVVGVAWKIRESRAT